MPVLDVVLHVSRTPDIKQLQSLGLKVTAALDTQHFRVPGVTDTGQAILETLSFAVSAAVFKPSFKPDKKLRAQSLTTTVTARVGGGEEEAPAAVLDCIGELKAKNTRRVLLKVAASRLQESVSVPAVIAAEPVPDNKIQNNVARSLIQVAPLASDMSLDGNGEIVGLVASIPAPAAGRDQSLGSIVEGIADQRSLCARWRKQQSR